MHISKEKTMCNDNICVFIYIHYIYDKNIDYVRYILCNIQNIQYRKTSNVLIHLSNFGISCHIYISTL